MACAALLNSSNRPNSVRKVESATRMPKSTVQRNTQKNKIEHYKTHLFHGLFENNPDRLV